MSCAQIFMTSLANFVKSHNNLLADNFFIVYKHNPIMMNKELFPPILTPLFFPCLLCWLGTPKQWWIEAGESRHLSLSLQTQRRYFRYFNMGFPCLHYILTCKPLRTEINPWGQRKGCQLKVYFSVRNVYFKFASGKNNFWIPGFVDKGTCPLHSE